MKYLSLWHVISWMLWSRSIAFSIVKTVPIPRHYDENHDARLWRNHVRSSLQRFTDRIVVRSSKEASDWKETEERYLQDPKFVERNKRWIVLVDDEESIRLAVGDFLYDRGYQVTACADADSMLNLCSLAVDDVESKEDGLLSIPDAIIRFVGYYLF